MPLLDRGGLCAICLRTFPNIHAHHVHPQAYGGREGKLVELCPSHHTDIHNTASAIIANHIAGRGSPPPWGNPVEWARALHFIRPIVQYGIAARANGSHIYRITLELTAEEHAAIKELKIRLGVSSQEKAVRKSLMLTYRTLTGKTKFA